MTDTTARLSSRPEDVEGLVKQGREIASDRSLYGDIAARHCCAMADALESLQAQLSTARADALEEAAKVAETFASENIPVPGGRTASQIADIRRHVRDAGKLIAQDIRSLAAQENKENANG